MKPAEFLSSVFNHTTEDGDWVFLATKRKGKWKDHKFQIGNGFKRRIKEFLINHPSSEYDLYFCPLAFDKPKRLKIHARPINCLWSDIDDGDPKIKPTLLWESSPGRLQGLWFLRGKKMEPQAASDLNRDLTYYMGADKGGFDITQVLRIPGTKNHKYKTLPTVRVLIESLSKTFTQNYIRGRMGVAEQKKVEAVTKASTLTGLQVRSKYNAKIPASVKKHLAAKNTAGADRSSVLWYLEQECLSLGMSPEEVIAVLRDTVWNKHRNRPNQGEDQLRKELNKIVASQINTEDEGPENVDKEKASNEADAVSDFEFSGFKVATFHDLVQTPERETRWIVENYWPMNSYGLVAGEAKSFKSTLSLDLCMAIATGEPFLGRHKVNDQGPVLYIQNENSEPIMTERMLKLMNAYGRVGEVKVGPDGGLKVTMPQGVEFYTINNAGVMLDDELHKENIEEIIKEIKPKMVVFDPFYLMFSGDFSSASELAPVLGWLKYLNTEYKCALQLVHHYNKGSGDSAQRGGNRIMGSMIFHAWVESAWYLSVDADQELDEDADIDKASATGIVTLEREFRGTGQYPKIDVTITQGNDKDVGEARYHYEAVESLHVDKAKPNNSNSESQIDSEIIVILKGGQSAGTSEKHLASKTGFTLAKVISGVDRLVDRGEVKRNGKLVKLIVA